MFRVWDLLPITTKALSFISTFSSCKGCLLQILHREVLRKALTKFISKHSLGDTVEGRWIFYGEFFDSDLQHCLNWWKGSPILHVFLTWEKPFSMKGMPTYLDITSHSDARVLLILNLQRLLSYWKMQSLYHSLKVPACPALLTSLNSLPSTWSALHPLWSEWLSK